MTDTGRRLARVAQRLRAVTAERDALIHQMRAEGATLRQIAAAAGLSAMGVKKLLDRSGYVEKL